MAQTTNELRKKLDGLLAQARDVLLDWSRGALKAKSNEERHQADFVFKLAKETDDLRRRIGDLANGEYPTYESEEHAISGSPPVTKKRHGLGTVRRRKGDYPKYLRRGNAIVKVGLSRDKRSEYKHIVPAAECQRAMELVTSTGANGKEFTADDLLNGFDGLSYHLYAVLALLRQRKAVVVVRRGVYKLSKEFVDKGIESIWKALPEEVHE